MAATVEIDESNGSTEVITHNIANSNYGSTDTATLNAINYPIVPGDNAFEKWQRLHVTNMGGSVAIRSLRYFATAPAANTTHQFNGHTTQGTYDSVNHKQLTYLQPTVTPTRTPEIVPVVAPSTANIGVGGNLVGEITTAPQFFDYILSQIRTNVSATAGTTITITFRYDEIA
jgi:hypothetical protein